MPRHSKSARRHKSCCPLTGQPVLRQIAASQTARIQPNFPTGLAQPALRALLQAGLESIEQLSLVSESELLQLHGMGPAAVKKLRIALQKMGLDFR